MYENKYTLLTIKFYFIVRKETVNQTIICTGVEFHCLLKCIEQNVNIQFKGILFTKIFHVVKFETLFNVTNINQLTNVYKLLYTIMR